MVTAARVRRVDDVAAGTENPAGWPSSASGLRIRIFLQDRIPSVSSHHRPASLPNPTPTRSSVSTTDANRRVQDARVAPAPRRRGARPRFVLAGLAAVPLGALGLSLLLTPPLEPPAAAARPLPPPEPEKVERADARSHALAWPESRLEGHAAKELLLEVLLAAQERLEAVEGYTARLIRRERIKGRLGPQQVMDIKVRHRPFAVYMKFINPEPGKEAVYCEGRYDNHVMAHAGGLSRALIPRVKVPPDSPIALAGNRRPITDAGLLNLTRRLVGYRRLDLVEDDAFTVLDRVTGEDGRTWLRSVHDHANRTPDRPFTHVEVLYDPDTKLPHRIDCYEWPDASNPGAGPRLAESYHYDDLVLDAPLTDLDFDPANPAYEFKRF
jgi:hypothetical protein